MNSTNSGPRESEHRFVIEVTAISHGPVKNEENWREGVERHVARTLLFDAGNYSAILRVNPKEAT